MAFATQERGIPWVLVAVEAANSDGKVLIFEMENWRSRLDASDREYLDALLDDWRLTTNHNGDALLDSLGDLAIGPIRTQLTGHCTREQLDVLTQNLNERTG